MINREDMLELTRRMTPARTCFDRIAGAYINDMGEVEDSFNVHFGKLSGSEKSRNLALAKTIPFAKTNEQLKEYTFSEKVKGKDSVYTLLRAIQQCGLKNDALMELLYEQIADGFRWIMNLPHLYFMGLMMCQSRRRIRRACGIQKKCIILSFVQ